MKASGAFGVPLFRALWGATIVSNVGTLMQGTAAAWLMTTLTDSPLLVGLVQTAATVPAFLVGLPGGVLADTLDRRRWLMATQGVMMLAAVGLGVVTLQGSVSPAVLLGLTFLMGTGAALNLPAWQAMVQDIVSRQHVASAVSLNSISFNLARTIGPALGGWLTAMFGAGVVFLINGASFLGTVGVLATWRRAAGPPRERVALRRVFVEGARFVWGERRVRSAMARAGLFVMSAAAIGALLPLVARDRLGLPAWGFGTLLALYGLGSVTGALILPWVRGRLGVERVVGVANGCYAVGMVGLALAPNFWLAGAALLFTGVFWTGTLVNLNVTVQMAAPLEVRGRAMSFYLLTFQGAFAVGSLGAGFLGTLLGLQGAILTCAGVMIVGWLFRGWFPLEGGNGAAEVDHNLDRM